MRSDGSMLVTAVHQRELWHVPRPGDRGTVPPDLVHTFDHLITGIAEVEPDVFIVNLTDLYTTHESHLARIDLNGWTPGTPVSPETALTFDDRVRGLNGSCLVAPGVLLVADCFAGLIWRVDLAAEGQSSARIWLQDDTMAMDPRQPGRLAASTGSQRDPLRSNPQPSLLHLDRAESVHAGPGQPRQLRPRGGTRGSWPRSTTPTTSASTRMPALPTSPATVPTPSTVFPLEPQHGSEVRHVAGDPFDGLLTGPSSAAWGRNSGDHGRVAYVTTDGGTTAPPDGVLRESKVLRVRLEPGNAGA